jgi:hypothetical protein
MRRMFDLVREKIKQSWIKFPNKCYNLYSSQNAIFMINQEELDERVLSHAYVHINVIFEHPVA